MNSDPSTPHDDGLEWLRDIRRRMFQQADGDLKKLGDRYRRVQSEHPEKTFDPREASQRSPGKVRHLNARYSEILEPTPFV